MSAWSKPIISKNVSVLANSSRAVAILMAASAVTATLGDDGTLAQRYGALPPEAIAQALFWLATSGQAPAVARGKDMLDLPELVKTQGLWQP